MSNVNYRIGGLFPKKRNGQPNLILSDGLSIGANNTVVSKGLNPNRTDLNTSLDITTNPVRIPGIDNFINNWLVPQMTSTNNGFDGKSLFATIASSAIGKWTKQPRNRTMATLVKVGYQGPGSGNAATNNAYWNAKGTKSDALDGLNLYDAIKNIDYYDPQAVWGDYDGSLELQSNFDREALLAKLPGGMDEAGMHGDGMHGDSSPDYWYPNFLYTYTEEGQGTSLPGPVLFLQPGNDLNIDFSNRLAIPGLTLEQAQQATLISNSSYGNDGSDGLGGNTSVNYHFHGSHTNPGGFGDNVVARYTTGQNWTTEIPFPEDHGQGSYWYHPHYHPSVNQQVYGGLTGFAQIGDPLSKIPDFKDIPRNVAVMKQLGVALDNGAPTLTGWDSGTGNTQYMVTVNGEFQPTADAGQGGWQSLTLSNQSNKDFYFITLENQNSDGGFQQLPIYIYGEDGHQFPQIRSAKGNLGSFSPKDADGRLTGPTEYSQADNTVALAPGKRVDLLVYLPAGKTQLKSLSTSNSFTEDGVKYSINNTGAYKELSTSAEGKDGGTAGPLAYFDVQDGTPALPAVELDAQIAQANLGIEVQDIEPTTVESEYDSSQVPSVDLFSDQWNPIKKREFNWAKTVLVGPEDEQDAATQAVIQEYEEANPGKTIDRYRQLPISKQSGGRNQASLENWLGYENPFLINDHVFPNGTLSIAQLGTIEEWDLKNWSVNSPLKYIGHPFHIHINDYQVKDSDTELGDKRNLEDVTMVNASGYKAYNNKFGQVDQAEPFRGEFYSIDEATDPDLIEKEGIGYNSAGYADLATWGANNQTVRMLFQDYLGTYVFHCHILPHEDAGMMQVLTVVENTDSSWIVPVQGFSDSPEIEIRLAQDFSPRFLQPDLRSFEKAERVQVGDLSDDFVQDVVLTTESSKKNKAGKVRVFDGSVLSGGETSQFASFSPYQTRLAPYAFVEDFTGDGQRELFTAGFNEAKNDGSVDLENLTVNGWVSTNNQGEDWNNVFEFNPFESISTTVDFEGKRYGVTGDLSSDQLGVVIADMNLDNFQDVVVAFKVGAEALRFIVLDGAALSLSYQTGEMEGGYFPDTNVLADAVFVDSDLSDLSRLVLTSGFNSYAQSALENVVITAESGSRSKQYTMQLQAGHFLATAVPDSTSGHAAHGGHGAHGASPIQDERIINLRNDSLPVVLADELDLPDETESANPVLVGAQANGAVLLGDYLLIAQGNSANGNKSNSNQAINTTQQLVVNIPGLLEVTDQDLIGATDSDLTTTFNSDQVEQRGNLTGLAYLAYTGTTVAPSDQAQLSAGVLGQGESSQDLATTLLANYNDQITNYYGGEFDSLSVKEIVNGATQSLYGREADSKEISLWQQLVQDGLDPSLIPLSVLQSTSGADLFRVAFLSAGSQWSQFQWATNANVDGSFGQGLQGDLSGFNLLSDALTSVGGLSSWNEAQNEYDAYRETVLSALTGSEVSKSGFF